MRIEIRIKSVAYHRNGVSGAPFFVVTFTDQEEKRDFVATLFPEYEEVENADGSWNSRYVWGIPSEEFHNPKVAVLDLDLVGAGEVRFGYNSWRGDNYADALLAAVNEWSDLPFEEKYPSEDSDSPTGSTRKNLVT